MWINDIKTGIRHEAQDKSNGNLKKKIYWLDGVRHKGDMNLT
jgi:hypothetical protein